MAKVNIEDYHKIKNRVNEDSEPLQEIVTEIVSEHCKALDDYMEQIDKLLRENKEISTKTIEDILLNIDSILYWAGNGLESATLRESVAKMVKEEQYNVHYNKTEGTIGDKTAQAKLESQQEELIRQCFTNAVKLYQMKIDRASEMASAMKKILTHRISEMELSRTVI